MISLTIKSWLPMLEINRRSPESMTVEERMDEVSALLARGIYRLWEQSVSKSKNMASKTHLGLGYSGDQSVHTNPSNNVMEAK
jgi:hypothetical protein